MRSNLSIEQGEREEQRYSASLSKPQTNKGNSAGIAMKKVVLNELFINNFKGVTAHHVFGEHENKVSGRNASGKTTIVKAWFWLLSGRSSADTVANSDLFDNRYELDENTPTASVKAVVTIEGEKYTIERTAKAKFTRKRGTSSYEKASSDEYHFFIDEIERNATDFKEWLTSNIASEDMLQYLLGGEFFIGKIFDDKKAARAIIEKTVGTVTREEMSGDYSAIDVLLQTYSLDEIDAFAQRMAKSVNDRLNEIPTLIRNKEAEVSEIEQTDFVATDREISELEAERDRLDKQMTDLTERIKPQMEAKHEAERIKQMKADMYERAYIEWKNGIIAQRDNIIAEINAIKKQNEKSVSLRAEAERRREDATARQKKAMQLYEEEEKKRSRLLEERDEEKNRKFDQSAATCPFCGHLLEGEKLQEQIDKFEAKKRERINQIVFEGKATAAELKRLSDEIQSLHNIIAEPLPDVINQSFEELNGKALELANADMSKSAFNATEHGFSLLKDIDSVQIPEVTMPDNTEIVEAKKQVNAQLVPLYERRGLKNRLTTLRNALDELRIEQKEKGADLATYEQQRQAVKDYKQEQMEILSRKVNDGLKFSRLEVWSKQKDGTVVGDLVLKDANGVNFSTSNNASRLTTVVDVQRFFCEKLGVNMPCFIDECAIFSSGNLPKLDNVQMFYLFCADTSLKIESK